MVIVDTCPNWILVWTSKLDSSLEKAAIQNVAALHYYMVYIVYFTELKLQMCDYAKNDAFVTKIVNTRLTKISMAIFAPDERLPSSATLVII